MVADYYVGQIHSHEDGLYCDHLRIDWRPDRIAELKHPGLSSIERAWDRGGLPIRLRIRHDQETVIATTGNHLVEAFDDLDVFLIDIGVPEDQRELLSVRLTVREDDCV